MTSRICTAAVCLAVCFAGYRSGGASPEDPGAAAPTAGEADDFLKQVDRLLAECSRAGVTTAQAMEARLGLQGCAVLGDLGLDGVDVEAHIHAVRHGVFMGVFADHIFIEKPEGTLVRRGR